MNLSSLVKKWDKINAIIGATDSKRPAVFDCIYISAQLIKLKGIKFPINPINPINIKSDLVSSNLNFFILK